jgi:hypothetical protein
MQVAKSSLSEVCFVKNKESYICVNKNCAYVSEDFDSEDVVAMNALIARIVEGQPSNLMGYFMMVSDHEMNLVNKYQKRASARTDASWASHYWEMREAGVQSEFVPTVHNA